MRCRGPTALIDFPGPFERVRRDGYPAMFGRREVDGQLPLSCMDYRDAFHVLSGQYPVCHLPGLSAHVIGVDRQGHEGAGFNMLVRKAKDGHHRFERILHHLLDRIPGYHRDVRNQPEDVDLPPEAVQGVGNSLRIAYL